MTVYGHWMALLLGMRNLELMGWVALFITKLEPKSVRLYSRVTTFDGYQPDSLGNARWFGSPNLYL